MSGRVLVVRLDSVGDVLLAGPAVRAIAAAGRDVWMLCGPQGAPAARLLPGVRGVIVWDSPWTTETDATMTRKHAARLQRLVRRISPDEVVVLTSFHQSPLPAALLLRLAGVPRISGASVDAPGRLLDVRLRPGDDLPEDQPEPLRALAIAEAAGYRLPAGDDGRLRVTDTPDVSHLVGTGPYVVVHPGASVPARAWPPAHHAEAVRLLAADGIRVVVTGSGSETALTAQVADDVALDLGGRTDLATLAGVLSGASVVLTGNTGPAHLAAAVGTPIVSLFSPVVPAVRWAPYGVPVVLLGDQAAPCRDTRARECPIAGHACLSGVSPQEAVDACLELRSGDCSRSGRELPAERALSTGTGTLTSRGLRGTAEHPEAMSS